MCTLLFAWQVFEDAPVLVAANRDEALGRPSHPPGIYGENPRVIAPWDEEAGGTWIGYNEFGVSAVITNRWLDADLAGERSRGLLVGEALERESAEDAARFVERSVGEFEYDGFNLALLDENAALLLEWDGGLRVRNVDPGVHVVVNVGADGEFEIPPERAEFGERQAESARQARQELQPEPGERSAEWHERAAAVLRDHDYGFCVHAEEYGTRSSSLIRAEKNGATSYRFADGPPCETGYEPVEP
ncbi:NRDE family protein [Halalkalicoccus subterraneus]|uniref:NRDE family protein n=1 Tax=Halalkalicoccus subterraneus TaxID=2675002 RepID=UPI000EFAE253|nr:NRDE family protein [Halalkalicoccus subterraneus]